MHVILTELDRRSNGGSSGPAVELIFGAGAPHDLVELLDGTGRTSPGGGTRAVPRTGHPSGNG
jgi:hypothetical protein